MFPHYVTRCAAPAFSFSVLLTPEPNSSRVSYTTRHSRLSKGVTVRRGARSRPSIRALGVNSVPPSTSCETSSKSLLSKPQAPRLQTGNNNRNGSGRLRVTATALEHLSGKELVNLTLNVICLPTTPTFLSPTPDSSASCVPTQHGEQASHAHQVRIRIPDSRPPPHQLLPGSSPAPSFRLLWPEPGCYPPCLFLTPALHLSGDSLALPSEFTPPHPLSPGLLLCPLEGSLPPSVPPSGHLFPVQWPQGMGVARHRTQRISQRPYNDRETLSGFLCPDHAGLPAVPQSPRHSVRHLRVFPQPVLSAWNVRSLDTCVTHCFASFTSLLKCHLSIKPTLFIKLQQPPPLPPLSLFFSAVILPTLYYIYLLCLLSVVCLPPAAPPPHHPFGGAAPWDGGFRPLWSMKHIPWHLVDLPSTPVEFSE